MSQRETLGPSVVAEVRYEDIIRNPDQVQAYLAQVLGLEIIAPWSDYPAFVPDDMRVSGDEYALRPLSDASIGKRINHQEVLADIGKAFEEQLSEAGYL